MRLLATGASASTSRAYSHVCRSKRPSSSAAARHPLTRQEIIGRTPTGQRCYSTEPRMQRRVTCREIVPALFAGEEQVSDHRHIRDSLPITDDEGLMPQMLFDDSEKVIEPPAQESQHLRIGRRRERPLESICSHVTGKLVVVPEKPAQDFEALTVGLAAILAVPL